MKKQLVLIMTDTTRKDMLGCYGDPRMKTPNLDRLAAEGIRYENAYSCQPVCGPARSAIFTGTAPHTNGMVTNCMAFREDVKTIGQYLTSGGIHSGYIGKWHLDGGDYFGYGICPDGWDEKYWYDMKCFLDELTPEQRMRSRKSDTAYDSDWGEEMTYAHRCSDRAVSFLRKYGDEDFFLTVSYDEPHGPCICPAPYNSMYKDFKFKDSPKFSDPLTDKPLMQRLWAGDAMNKSADEINSPSKKLALFLGCNSFVDYEIGRVLDEIRKSAPDAMIIFTSDHGDMLGAHRLQQKNAAVYREVANIPLIIKGGERGKVVNYPASHIDIAPTVLDYFGLHIPVAIEGRSMLSQIYDVDTRINDEVYVEFTRYEVDHDGYGGLQMMRAIIDDNMKLAIHLLDTDELYDLRRDPDEMHNLIYDPDYAEIRNSLHDKLLEHMNVTRDLYRGYQWAARPWRTDRQPRWENDGWTRQRENDPGQPRQLDYSTGLVMESASRRKVPNKKH